MPSNGNVVDEARALIQKRLAELDDEQRKLERAVVELEGRLVGRAELPARRAERLRTKGAGGRRRGGPAAG